MRKIMASALVIMLLTSNLTYAAPTETSLKAPEQGAVEEETKEANSKGQEIPKKQETPEEEQLSEDTISQERFYEVLQELLEQKGLYPVLKKSKDRKSLETYVKTLKGQQLYIFIVFMQHEFLDMVVKDVKALQKEPGKNTQAYKEILDYALGEMMIWGTLLEEQLKINPLDKKEREDREKELFVWLKGASPDMKQIEENFTSLRKYWAETAGVDIENLYEMLGCFRREPEEGIPFLERQRKAMETVYKAYGFNVSGEPELPKEEPVQPAPQPTKGEPKPEVLQETEEKLKEAEKTPDILEESTKDTISGEGTIKGLTVGSHIKETARGGKKGNLVEMAAHREDLAIFSVQAEVEGIVDKAVLTTWFSGAGQKKQDKRHYEMKEEQGQYGVEIPYSESGIYKTTDGILHYELTLKDASGRTLETSEEGSVQAYGGYLDGSYLGVQSKVSLQERGRNLEVRGSFAMSTNTLITGTVRIYGDSTLWLETQNGNPSLYLNGNTSVIGDGVQSKVIMSRKLRLKDDAGSIAVQSGTATISNISFSSEDHHIGGTSGKSHGIWGNAGTSLTIRGSRLSSRATWTIVGTYGNVYAETSTFQEGTTGIHFNGSFGSSLEVRTRDCVFQNLNEGIQGGSINGKRSMSLYVDGQNRFRDINRQAITVSDGAFLSFASNSVTGMERVGGGVKVDNFNKAAIRNVNMSGRSTGEGLWFVRTPGEILKSNITGFFTGVQTQGGSHVKSMESQTYGNQKGVMNQATYEQVSGSVRGNTDWGVHHDGDSLWFTGGSIAGNRVGDVYLERGKVIDWKRSANTEKTRVLSADRTLGTPLVQNRWQENGAIADGQKAEDYFTAMHGGRFVGRGGNRSRPGDKRLVLSTSYDVTYHKNSSDQIGNMPNNGIKYWNEKYDIPKNEPKNMTYSFIEFEGWDTVADGNVDKLPGGQLTDNKNTSLKAVWRDNIRVYYNSNDTENSERFEQVSFSSIKANGGRYEVQENGGWTDFTREKHAFAGFDLNPNQSAVNASYKEGQEDTISFEEMLRHAHKVQGILILNMYAIWDKLPEITVNGKREFYEGTDVFRGDLMSDVTAYDQEDGDLTGQLKIVEIRYGEGKLSQSGTPALGGTISYPDGMGEKDKLDTWFMVLDQEKSPVSHEVVYEVTDSAGGITRGTQKVQVKYNEFPELFARDRYFTLEAAQNGEITEEALLGTALAEGKVTVSDKEEDAKDPAYMKDRLSLTWFDPTEFTAAKGNMMVLQEIAVKDSMGPGGEGKETTYRFQVHVRKVGKVEKQPPTSKVRGIDEENYRKNEDKWKLNLSQEEKDELNKNGGLNVDSIWYKSPAHKEILESCFRNEVKAVYKFDHKDVLAVQEFIEENGIGRSKDLTALKRFADRFLIDVKDQLEEEKTGKKGEIIVYPWSI